MKTFTSILVLVVLGGGLWWWGQKNDMGGLSDKSGEIFIAPKAASRQAALFGEPTAKYIGRLFIQGLLHLKGYRHGSKMEHEERKILRRIDS